MGTELGGARLTHHRSSGSGRALSPTYLSVARVKARPKRSPAPSFLIIRTSSASLLRVEDDEVVGDEHAESSWAAVDLVPSPLDRRTAKRRAMLTMLRSVSRPRMAEVVYQYR